MSIVENTVRNQRGITLIELLTVMVVVGILAAIAMPTYSQYSRKAKRTDAKKELTSLSQKLERCFTRLQTYNDSTNCPTGLPYTTQNNDYTISVAWDTTAGLPTGTSYTLSATPIGTQTSDTQCGTYSLTQTGTQGASGTLGAAGCW